MPPPHKLVGDVLAKRGGARSARKCEFVRGSEGVMCCLDSFRRLVGVLGCSLCTFTRSCGIGCRGWVGCRLAGLALVWLDLRGTDLSRSCVGKAAFKHTTQHLQLHVTTGTDVVTLDTKSALFLACLIFSRTKLRVCPWCRRTPSEQWQGIAAAAFLHFHSCCASHSKHFCPSPCKHAVPPHAGAGGSASQARYQRTQKLPWPWTHAGPNWTPTPPTS